MNDANVRKIAMGGKDVDITQLLNNVPIDGVSHVVATAKAKDGTKWQWTVKIDVDAPGMPNRTEKDLGTLKDGTKERRLTIHVNSKDAATQTTAAAESAAGRHLFHEAIHANLIMDGDRIAIGVATKSQLFTDFQKDLVTASQVGPERTSLVQAVGAIVASAGPSTPARSQGWTNGAVEFLVTERFAARRTSATFGQVASNAKIADAYVGEVFGRLPGHNTNAGAMLGRNLSGLITNFFNAMDRHP